MNINFALIKAEAQKFFSDAKTSHDWEHTERVYQNVLKLGEKAGADLAVLKVAAYLHDIGRKWQDESNGEICHARKGAELAAELLKNFDLEEDFIQAVLHCVECHRASDDSLMPQSLEAKILYDADKLDNLGAIGIGRGFMFAAEIGAKLHDPAVDLENTSPYSEDDTAYRYFLETQSKIKDKMMTEQGRLMAQERYEFMLNFFNKLNEEMGVG